MNDKERARKLLNSLYGWNPKFISFFDAEAEADYESVVDFIRAVRDEEREACAKIAEKLADDFGEIQENIRQQGCWDVAAREWRRNGDLLDGRSPAYFRKCS